MSTSKVKKVRKTSVKKTSTATGDLTGGIEPQPLTLVDASCPICLSVMIKPVTMPCSHSLCLVCFESNVSESNLACPMCRKRISIWVRKMTKTKTLVDEKLWSRIQNTFPEEVESRMNGEDNLNNTFTSTLPPRKVSAPGEIRADFEAELKRLGEEEEKKRKEEEKISLQLQEEESRYLEQLENERKRLLEEDFEFAKRLRTFQMDQKLNSIRAGKGKSPKQMKVSLSPRGSLDLFLGQVTPIASTSTKSSPCTFHHSATVKEASNFSDEDTPRRDNPSDKSASIASSCLRFPTSPISSHPPFSSHSPLSFVSRRSSSPPSSSHPPYSSHPPSSSHPRLLKDITLTHSSESESEFDSEENIAKERRVVRSHKAINKENKEWRVEKPSLPRAKSKRGSVQEEDVSVTQLQDSDERVKDINLILKMMDENKEIDEELLQSLLEEQKQAEERLRQEKEDRILALQLQKEDRVVNRSKGSEDEYNLRGKQKHATKRASPSPPLGHGHSHLSTSSPARKKQKTRQATLLECLSKNQRRL